MADSLVYGSNTHRVIIRKLEEQIHGFQDQLIVSQYYLLKEKTLTSLLQKAPLPETSVRNILAEIPLI